MAEAGTSRSTGPSPATVTTSKPERPHAWAQLAATIDTPSVRPRRNETKAQVGMGGRDRSGAGEGPAVSGATVAGRSTGPTSGPTRPTTDSGAGRRRPPSTCSTATGAPPGFCVPNADTYPWQWLWDSCFHAVCWAHLGHPRPGSHRAGQRPAHQAADGFVPHMTYWSDGRPDDDTHADFWGRPGTSSITQPPMYGHAVAELVGAASTSTPTWSTGPRRGLRFLLEAAGPRRGRAGHRAPVGVGLRRQPPLGRVVTAPPTVGARAARWKAVKGDLVEALSSTADGSPVASARLRGGARPASPPSWPSTPPSWPR